MKRTDTEEELNCKLKIRLPLTKSKIVLIGGGSASGKSTVARLLAERCTGARCISMDNFYRSLSPEENGETHNWDLPSAYDVFRIIECINAWRSGVPCWIPSHDFSRYQSIDRSEYILPSRIMIIEGIHALSIAELLPLADLKLFVTCDSDEALARRITRDTTERGYSITTILNRYFTYVKPAYVNVIAPSQKNADYVITNGNGIEVSRNNAVELIANVVIRL